MADSGPVWEPLSEDVRRTLEVLLAGDGPVTRALRAQIPYARMNAGPCPCPCVYLDVDTDAVAAAPAGEGDRNPWTGGASLINADGGYDGQATLFAYDGFLADLQFCDWEDRGPAPLRLWEWLGPPH